MTWARKHSAVLLLGAATLILCACVSPIPQPVAQNEEPSPLRLGEIAFLVDGPQTGRATLVPFQLACPLADALSAAIIDSLGGLQALACFGDSEITLSGQVECNRGIADGGIGGAPYFDSNRRCVLDALLGVYGDAVTAILGLDLNMPRVSGTFEVRGHMDDPGARGCGWIPVGVRLDSPTTPDPWAVVWCRQNFVVTTIARAD